MMSQIMLGVDGPRIPITIIISLKTMDISFIAKNIQSGATTGGRIASLLFIALFPAEIHLSD
jgi:hypothetical protein